MNKNWSKFKLLMWKNFVLQYRRPIYSIIEVLTPIIFSMCLVLLRGSVEPERYSDRVYETFNLVPQWLNQTDGENMTHDIAHLRSIFPRDITLAYSPFGNSLIDTAMERFRRYFPVQGYINSKTLEAHFLISNQSYAAFQFDDNLRKHDVDFPKELEVQIRFPGELRYTKSAYIRENNWHTDRLYPIHQFPGPRSPNDNMGGSPHYTGEGFLTLQITFTYFLILANSSLSTPVEIFNTTQIPLISMQRFPYASWISDPLLSSFEKYVGVAVMLSYVFPCINTVKLIAAEKESQLKETMKIMGLPNWLHWTTWFIKSFICYFVSSIIVVILLKVRWYPTNDFSVFTYADPSIIFLLLILYSCATITFCFLVSVVFSRSSTAATAAALLWFISFFPYFFLQFQYDELNLFTKVVACFGSNSAMGFGFQLMVMYEGVGEGVQWYNVYKPVSPEDNISLAVIFVMLIADALIYLILALYIEAVFPGEFGVPMAWYFCFSPKFWKSHPEQRETKDPLPPLSTVDPKNLEREPKHAKPGIIIYNLRKVFGNKPAVKNLSMNLYDGQITVLLGHNGAGKTTTMSMLTGMISPTSGTAIINGYDIRYEIDEIRESLGLCPQNNILFDDLTVREHLYFFTKLKGIHEPVELKCEVDNYINFVRLRPKAKSKASTLSGGMKRKLCVAIALCGNSKVVLLDEPTAGMDPQARRGIWDLLQSEKKTRTIILTTHFMDEADLLGDRIAIMAAGDLQCCGSSFFLKKRYGAGYKIIIDKQDNCDTGKITKLLHYYIPDIRIHTNVGTELTYLLDEHKSHRFEKMLVDLEVHSEKLKIRSYGISLTTLEEVFLKVGAAHRSEEQLVPPKRKFSFYKFANFQGWKYFLTCFRENKINTINFYRDMEDFEPLRGAELLFNQFIAMSIKKIAIIIRSWQLLLLQNMVPVMFLLIAICIMEVTQTANNLPALSLTLEAYTQNPIIVMSKNTTNRYQYGIIRSLDDYQIQFVNDIKGTMLNLTKERPLTVNRRYLAGFECFTGPVSFVNESAIVLIDQILVFFNNNPYHTPGVAISIALNAVYNLFTNRTIRFVNYPFRYSTNEQAKYLYGGSNMGFQMAFNIAFSMAFVAPFFLLFVIKERASNAKHLQFIAGVNIGIFWLTAFLFDLLTFFVTIICIVIAMLCFQEEGFRSYTDMARVVNILFCFGLAVIPMMYVASFLFKSPTSGFTIMSLFNVFTGVGNYLLVVIMKSPSVKLADSATKLHWALMIFPHYTLASAIQDSYIANSFHELCHIFVKECEHYLTETEMSCKRMACLEPHLSKYCCSKDTYYYKMDHPGIGSNIVYFFGLSLILFFVLYLIERKVFKNVKIRRYFEMPKDPPGEDMDVSEEKDRIRTMDPDDRKRIYALVLKDVTKYYGKVLAVNNICLGVKEHECFGLLGVNGAGKTTTFKIMTGDERMSNGEALVNETSITKNLRKVQQMIGYCPQFDALIDDMTPKEILVMFALLRGVPQYYCGSVAKKLAEDLRFHEYFHKQISHLSGGNKRKVSTAVALVGNPTVLYLDEPTAGIDPDAKRHLWNAIIRERDRGRCIILTSHLMEECEALCTRLAVMVNGSFKCLGSTQHLKNKFLKGYTLSIKLKRTEDGQVPETMDVQKRILQLFPKTKLRERFQELLTFYIADMTLPCSKMFGIMEKCKKELDIEDYSLGQCNLEQVFLIFTKGQRSTQSKVNFME